MQKNRRQRFHANDLRELEELVWRDLNAAVRAANERAAVDAMSRRSVQSKAPARASDVAQPVTATEVTPRDPGIADAIDDAAAQSGIADPASPAAPDSAAAELDAAEGAELMSTLVEDADAPTGAEWSDAGDEQFLDGVAEWLHQQEHPDQMIAEIWGRLLALRAPAPGLEAAVTVRRFQ